MQNIFTDAVGFAGCELIRRTIGLAHVADLDEITNKETRIQAKKQALSLGKELIKYESKTLIFNCSDHYSNRQFLEGKSMSTIVTIPRSVSWKGNAIAVLNQTKLPHSTEYKTLTTIEEVWKSIVMLEVRGAPAIGIVAAFGLALASKKYDTVHIEEFQKKFNRDCNYLGTSRPTAVNLFWAIDRMRESIREITTIKEAQKY